MILIVLLVPLIFGLTILSLFLGKQASWLEKLALAFSLGLGFLTIIMFLMTIVKIPLTLFNIILMVALLIGLLAVYLFRTKRFCLSADDFKSNQSPLDWQEWILFFLIGLKVAYVFFAALIKPLIDVDAFQFYSIVAKGIFYAKTHLTPYLAQFMGDKPPFPFLAQGWAFIGQNAINDSLLKVFGPALFLCLIIIIYSILKIYYTRKLSLLFTFLFCSLPFMLHHATTAYADFAMTFYFSLGSIYLYLFIKGAALNKNERSLPNLAIAIALLAIAVWVKRAGFILAGINIAVFLAFIYFHNKSLSKAMVNKALLSLVAFVIVLSPWLIFGQQSTFLSILHSLPGISTLKGPAATISAGSLPESKTGIIVAVFLRKLFLYGNWHLLWGMLITTLVFFGRKLFEPPLIYLLAMLTIALLSLFVQFESGDSFRWLLDGTLLDRLLMNEVPIALFLCIEAATPYLMANSKAGEPRVLIKKGKGS